MSGLLGGRTCREAFDLALTLRGRLKLHWFSSSCTAFREEQQFVGGFDNVRMPSSPVVSKSQHLLENGDEQETPLAVDNNQIRSLLKVRVCHIGVRMLTCLLLFARGMQVDYDKLSLE